MKKPATVRIKGAKWEALAGEDTCEQKSGGVSILTRRTAEEDCQGAEGAKAMDRELIRKNLDMLSGYLERVEIVYD